MPIEYCISQTLEVLYAKYSGKVDLDDILAILDAYTKDPLFKAGRPELIDHSDLNDIDATYDDARALLNQIAHAIPPGVPPTPTSIWAPKDQAFGMSRMYQAIAEFSGPIKVMVHRKERDALSSLGLPFSSIQQMRAAGAFTPMRHAPA